MKQRTYRLTFISLILSIFLVASSGCGSTRTEEGVTIEKKSSNPLKFF